jgi:hypothetical protein
MSCFSRSRTLVSIVSLSGSMRGQKGVASSAGILPLHCGQIRGAGWWEVPRVKYPMLHSVRFSHNSNSNHLPSPLCLLKVVRHEETHPRGWT